MSDDKERKKVEVEEGKDEKGRDSKTAEQDAYYAKRRKDEGIEAPVNPESQAKADKDMLENPSSAEAEGIADAEEKSQAGDAASGTGET